MLASKFMIVWKSLGALSERRIVSRPQAQSRLRYVNIVIRPDETVQERTYRLRYENLQNWNNKYWSDNNDYFSQEKDRYIKEHFKQATVDDEVFTHDQLAPFYRDFLEKSREKHVNYNKTWYKNHIALLYSSIDAKISRFRINLSKRIKTDR